MSWLWKPRADLTCFWKLSRRRLLQPLAHQEIVFYLLGRLGTHGDRRLKMPCPISGCRDVARFVLLVLGHPEIESKIPSRHLGLLKEEWCKVEAFLDMTRVR